MGRLTAVGCLQLVDASNKPVEVSAVEGGPVAESANFQFAINFGLVLGFSLSGDNIAKAEDGPELLLVMDVSDALAGKRLSRPPVQNFHCPVWRGARLHGHGSCKWLRAHLRSGGRQSVAY